MILLCHNRQKNLTAKKWESHDDFDDFQERIYQGRHFLQIYLKHVLCLLQVETNS